MFKPEIINSLKNYSKKQFFNDLIAGAIVSIVALPLSIAFAIASGVGPERGIFTAIIGGFIISALGGSKVQIGGPTGAFIVMVYGIMQQYGYNGLVIATILSGIILIILGACNLGTLVRYIPYTIITGFTLSIAVTIFTTQIGDFLGLTTPKLPADFLGKLITYGKHLDTFNVISFAIAAISLTIIFLWPKVSKKIPGAVIVIVLMTVICQVFNIPVDTIGSRFGEMPRFLPPPTIPHVNLQLIQELFPSALSLAILGAIISLSCAVVTDGMTASKHDSNTELIADGIANIGCGIFGGIPVTGAIARTIANIKNGGRTPIAGIVHAICLLLIMVLLGKYAVFIPMPALSAVLISAAWNMCNFKAIKGLFQGQKSDTTVFLVTLFTTLLVNLTTAILVGLLIAAFFFIKKIVDLTVFQEHTKGEPDTGNDFSGLAVPENALVYEINGALFFGTINKFEQALERTNQTYNALILIMKNTIYLDAGGIQVLEKLFDSCKKKKVTLILSNVHTQPLLLLHKSGLDETIGQENIFGDITIALEHARKINN
ncbi:MAG: SulP family inorganic anion transporter [Spirochaetaceae bacterium]|nr:SulP family inorganic anion transporter [Spirochaetaceae bacterium]